MLSRHLILGLAAALLVGLPAMAQTRTVAVTFDDLPYQATSEVTRAAEEYQCDAIFMASHGRRGLSRLIAGSQTQKVLAYAKVPVVVLRPALPAR